MYRYSICFILLLAPALSRHVPRYQDLDEDDQHLFRAAYDTPSYDQTEYEEDDLPLGKLDLVKDGLWALKAKIKELKAFDKALAANLLSTKLSVKDLLKNHLAPLKKHHHEDYEKPSYGYQAPSYQYEPQYAAPAPHYAAPAHQYAAPAPQYAAPQPQYAAPQSQYHHDPYYGQ